MLLLLRGKTHIQLPWIYVEYETLTEAIGIASPVL